jgi:peptidyl-prolyl cis-trans isomerase D
MAVIGTIRKQSGLLVIIVGVALAAFVLGDFLSPGGGRQQSFNIAEVLGEEISYTYFDEKFEQNLENQKRNQNKENFTQEEIFQIRQQTFDQIVQSIVLQNEYEKIGISVTADELFDQIQGDNPHPYILQFFKDPQTQQYDPELVRNYIRQLDQMDPNSRAQWDQFTEAIKDDRYRSKYTNLITKGYFLPDTFLAMDFLERKTTATARLVGVRYNSVADSLVTVDDEDLQSYYEKYKQDYKQEESRDIEYVIFDVRPSATDRKNIREDVFAIYEDFQTSENTVLFVNSESVNRYDSTFFKEGELPIRIDTAVFNSEVGKFVAPYIQDNQWHMAKLMDVQYRPDSMKASHVLISYQGALRADPSITRTRNDAKNLADSLLNIAKADPGRVEEIAVSFSDDPSAAENNGDLGWFADGSMVYPFNQAVLENPIGDVTLVESQFGFHIVKVTGKLDPTKKVRVAVIDIDVTPSQNTFQDMYAQASEFQGNATSQEAFDTLATSMGLQKRTATYLERMTNRIAGLDYPRSVIQWAYLEDLETGAVSPVFTMEDKYVVAILTAVHEEGIPPLSEVRDNLEPLVRTDLKGDVVVERMKKAMEGTKDLEQLASTLGATVDTAERITLVTRNIAGYGNESNVIAKILTMEPGEFAGPIKGNNTAFFIVLDEKTLPSADEDNTIYRRQLLMNFQAKVNNNSFINVLEEEADIEDNRVRFY